MDALRESRPDADEAQPVRKQRGWITFPFLAGNMLALGVALGGATSNIIVYLIKEFHVKSIDAAQISNIINGCTSLAPVAGAIVSDAYFGCFPIVAVCNFVSLMSTILFTVTATVQSLRPSPCALGSGTCESPSAGQLAVLYTAVALIAIGGGGTRFNTITFGANQFDKAGDQEIFFNWFFVIMYASAIIGATVIVYIQDTVSWRLGFGLCTAANAVGMAVLLLGVRYYRRPAAQGSPFIGLARVVIASIKKRELPASPESTDYYYGTGEGVKPCSLLPPTQSFRFLNRAALIAEGDTNDGDSTIARPWSLCTVEQVEDLKSLLRITPLWASSIFLSISIGIQGSLTVLQALTMDRSLGPRFTVPAASLLVSTLATAMISLSLIDRLLFPLWHRLAGRAHTPLQRIGVGHVLNVAGMAASALVERERAGVVRAHHAAGRPGWVVPMSALWLVLPLALTGAGEAMHFPGQVALYYQEFPESLKSTATGMIALIIALGFYLSTAVVDLVRRLTGWLPDNVNDSRLDNVYWMLAVVGTINFGYYVVCARLYKYKSTEGESNAAAANSKSAG